MAQAFMDKGYKVVSGGTDNHCMLIDLRTKFPELTGKKAENTLVKADITINKNMVPFDSRSPFQTSGIRVGTPAITTRGLKEEDMKVIVDMIDRILSNIDDENVIAEVKKEVNAMMNPRPMFLMATRPKRMPSSSTVKLSKDLFTSGGSRRIPHSLHSLIYSATLSELSSTEVSSAAIYSRA